MKKGKEFFIKKYFQEFENRIRKCNKLYNMEYKIEAATLLCCYIDALATYAYGYTPARNKDNFAQLLKEYSQYPHEFSKVIDGKRIAEQIYIFFRCGWVHNVLFTTPSAAKEFTFKVEYIDQNGNEEKLDNVVFPWNKMFQITLNILNKLYEKTKSGEIEFIK